MNSSSVVHCLAHSWDSILVSWAELIFATLPLFFISFIFFWPHHVTSGILVPWAGIEPMPSAVEIQSPNHWTTRKLPCPSHAPPSTANTSSFQKQKGNKHEFFPYSRVLFYSERLNWNWWPRRGPEAIGDRQRQGNTHTYSCVHVQRNVDRFLPSLYTQRTQQTDREGLGPCCCRSTSKSCLNLCDSMDCSTPGFPVFTISWSLLKFMSLSRWYHPTMSSSVSPFSSCPQSRLASGSFTVSWPVRKGKMDWQTGMNGKKDKGEIEKENRRWRREGEN